MALFLARLINNDDSVNVLLISSINKDTAEKTLKVVYPTGQIEICEEDPILIEQQFNEQYGGIALLNTV